MAQQFEDLRKFRDPDLILPIGGKQYRIKSPSALEGLRIRQLFAANVIGDESELAEIAKILGAHWVPDVRSVHSMDPVTGEALLDGDGDPIVVEADFGHYEGGVWSQMDADGVTWDEIMHAGRTALIDVGLGRIVAQAQWLSGADDGGGGQGNPLPPQRGNRKSRRRRSKSKASTDSTTPGRAPTAPTTPAAGSPTRSPGSGSGTTRRSSGSPRSRSDGSDGPTSSTSGSQ